MDGASLTTFDFLVCHTGLNVTGVEPANYIKSPLGVVFEKINDGVGSPAKPGDVWGRGRGEVSTSRRVYAAE